MNISDFYIVKLIFRYKTISDLYLNSHLNLLILKHKNQ
jgi:hypothetical protein